MEEDLKVLEEHLNTYKRHLENYEKDECLTSVYYQLKKYVYALENLLKRYKEKEETESRLLRIIEHSILKSKVKEVIDRKCKAFRHRTSIEKILECEFKRLEEELLEREGK